MPPHRAPNGGRGRGRAFVSRQLARLALAQAPSVERVRPAGGSPGWALLLMGALALAALARPAAARQDPPPPPAVLLNELDADQAGVDTAEFIELRAERPGQELTGFFLVLYNGSAPGGGAYGVVDLAGLVTDGAGLAVVGSDEVPGVDRVVFTSNGLQNGPDAVALWWAPHLNASHFAGRPATGRPSGAVLVDALVHSTGDGGSALLQQALAPGEHAVDEAVPGGPAERSLQRRPDGGEPFDADRWLPSAPTPGRPNGALRSVPIHALQGAGHLSPHEGALMEDVRGVVTAVRGDRFHVQTPPGDEDDDPATSEGLLVRVASGLAPDGPPAVGDLVLLTGWVVEHRPGNDGANLPTTRLELTRPWTTLASGTPLPPAVVLGEEGRLPPDHVLDDDTRLGRVTDGATRFDPEHCGLDYFEALEGMRVEVLDAVAVSATTAFGEVAVVGDGGRHATGLTTTGLLRRTADDPNPERILVDDALVAVPEVGAGDTFDRPLTGVLDYSFGAPKLLLDTPAQRRPGRLARPPLETAPEGWFTVATLNVRNLSTVTDPRVVADIARVLVNTLEGPELVALQEIQDGSGPEDDGTVSAAATLTLLTGAILAAGGPRYLPVEVPPVDGQDGGQPGGNIRVVLLHRTDSPLHLVSRPDLPVEAEPPPIDEEIISDVKRGRARQLAAHEEEQGVTVVVDDLGRPTLRPSPGRLAPHDAAWIASRKPLVVEYRWHDERVFVVNLHLRSRLGDTPLFGDWQPPLSASSAQRVAQVELVRAFAEELLRIDPGAALIVLGDLNDAEHSPALERLTEGGLLTDLVGELPADRRTTHVFEGNAEALDHVLVSPALLRVGHRLQALPVHAGRRGAPTDHDPLLLGIDLETWAATVR